MTWHADVIGLPGAAADLPPSVGDETMSEQDRAFHLERAAQCRQMAAEAAEPAVRQLHEQLARFHETEAQRSLSDVAANEDLA
jgi:hypothetical protein